MAKNSIKIFEQIYKSQYYQTKVTLEREEEVSKVHKSNLETEDKFDMDILFLSDSESEDVFSIPKNSKSPEWKWEIDYYCSQKRAGKNTDILEWWKKHATILPNLARMSRDFLCTSATSVPSERLFSRSSLVIRKHRNRLSNNSITQLMCLNSWNNCSLTLKIDSLIEKS
ncbi:uncharacterized protein LOC122506095 [Leptopilina heterotoma]|uniref:uncharacterized protein LOC122506095 n=1 Tax=Leptopilina heterotoma TaxID=63436 RepID=UPI001CA8C7E7|nr:uncharacterized protein LOC122506095 [Leptopilina heterotoma]